MKNYESIWLFEDLLFRELWGQGSPNIKQLETLRSLVQNKVVPIVWWWHIPKKGKAKWKLNLKKLWSKFFPSEK